MTRSLFVRILLTIVAAVIFVYVPKPVSARRDGGSRGGGGSRPGGGSGGRSSRGGGGGFRSSGSGRSYGAGRSRGASSHGSGTAPSGGGFSYKGGGRSYGGGYAGAGGMRNDSFARSRGFFSGPSGNSARNSKFGAGRSGSYGPRAFGSSADSRSSGRSASWQSAGRNSAGGAGARYSFGNSAAKAGGGFGNSGGRAVPASTRSWGNAIGSGWHSFGGQNRGGGAQMPRGYGSNARADGQWRSFGNARNGNPASNLSGWSSVGRNRVSSSYAREPLREFGSSRVSSNLQERSRFSSVSSFSSGRFMSNFSSSPSFIGPDFSILSSLLFGGLLRIGPALLGAPALLGGNVLASAASSIVSGLVSSGFGQPDIVGGVPSEFGQGFGWHAAPVEPNCSLGASFGNPGWAWGGYCGPYPTYSWRSNAGGYLGGGGNGYIGSGDVPAHPDFE
jgi:hypothetical protein